MADLNEYGGRKAHNTEIDRQVEPDLPPYQDAPAWTIITPNRSFNGILYKRQFTGGRMTTFNESVARAIMSDFERQGFRCDPELVRFVAPPPPPPVRREDEPERERPVSLAPNQKKEPVQPIFPIDRNIPVAP